MSLRSLAPMAALGLLLAGCASFNLGGRPADQAPAPVSTLPAVALDATVEGVGTVPPGARATLSLFDAANPAIALHQQEVPAGAFPIAARIEAPGELFDGSRQLALGALVKGPAGLPLYGTDAPAALNQGGVTRVTVVGTGL
ncbi:hypothetical protein [Neomegalonema sp.]|uniref:hypothetical protein n=1 Tax=Neomegalonema sp. TaxID=2039713 RepID=UPI0026370243|nr:hypothetical protein [Neomegalonema sp.]MDD2867594.1 hypothetical protein [Neomegalonema sp.]